jgi:superfamily I DNA and RNA helicase
VQGSRGSRLKALEDSIANLDSRQGQAVIETVDGVQRIRGLAGSGKTIILALKAAYLHAQHPDWKIAVTFNTRSLKAQLRRLINTFFIEQTNEEPDWDNLQILQAWGAPGGNDRNGLYYTFCRDAGVPFLDFAAAKSSFGSGQEFEGACEQALRTATKINPLYNAILVDEAQDFAPVFLRMCFAMLTKEKRLVYAYDELQNLNSKALPSPEEIFGNKPDGTPLVTFSDFEPGKPKQDITLQKCYRNSRPVLATAHALGFGIYRTPPASTNTGLIQMFDQPSLWEEVGYKVLDGRLQEDSLVTLARTVESSPLFLENHSPIDDLVQFYTFNSTEDQAAWLAGSIAKNLRDEELDPDDIAVINPDPLTTRDAVGLPRKLLFDAGINSHLTGVDTSPDIFFDTDGKSVAFTGIFRAKGNEAGMVYVINAQDCASGFGNLARMRNRLFTAITRSKAWVRVLGVGPQMALLAEEFNKVKEADFKLRFRYPTTSERAHLNIVNRDMTQEEKKKVKKGAQNLSSLIEDLSTGKIFIEDLPPEEVNLLKKFILSGQGK